MKAKRYQLNEVFYSLQGEGPAVGVPMVFVRFAGCNLRCLFCDTRHQKVNRTVTARELKEMVLEACGPRHGHPIVCFTGGEPCLQLKEELVLFLRESGFTLHLETNGTIPPPRIQSFDLITVSPKSGLVPPWVFRLREYAVEGDTCLKVIWDSQSPTQCNDIRNAWTAANNWNWLYLQPCTDGRRTKRNTEEVIDYVKAYPSWRLSIQTQKILKIR